MKFNEKITEVPEAAQERPSQEELARYLKREGYPDTSLFMVRHFVYGDNAAMFDEAVRNQYSLHEVERWAHLKDILGKDLSFRAAMMVDTALWVEDCETMELTRKEDILGTPRGITKERLEKLAAEYRAGNQPYLDALKLSREDAAFLVNVFDLAREPERKDTMNISIYQINKSRDPQRLVFSSYDIASKHMGGHIDASMYDKVYEGIVNAGNLEDVYCIFNKEHPADYRARSLSMSDVVEVKETGASQFYFCDTFGFRKIDFDPLLAQTKDGLKPSLASQISSCASRIGEAPADLQQAAHINIER